MNPELAATLENLHPDAFGWALHCCAGDHSLAEEVLQAAYLKLAQQRATHEGQSSFKTWWFGVIKYTSLEELRRLRFRTSLLGKLVALVIHDEHDPRPSPSAQMEHNERAAALRAALQQLPTRQAEVLHLVFYQDLSLAEAAQVMRVSLGSTRQHYERGKAKLRQLLQTPASHEG